MRITMTINSKDDIDAAFAALKHFISEKRDDDGTHSTWGIGIAGGTYFCVSVKQNGNYTVKQS